MIMFTFNMGGGVCPCYDGAFMYAFPKTAGITQK